MVSNKAARGQASNVSSSVAPTAMSTTHSAQKSSILRSRFSPSEFQLSLFASVIQGLEGQNLRIHDTATGRLRCEHAIKPKATINCLDWGHHRENHSDPQHQESKKKRKRADKVAGARPDPKDVVVAFGTSDSEIHLFSPSESKVLRVLRGEHTQGVQDFKFSNAGIKGQAWSVGGDGKMVQWDLQTGKSIMSLRAPSPSVAILYPTSDMLLCSSHTTYLVDLGKKKELHSFTASSNPVHSILTPQNQNPSLACFLTASEAERAINVFDVESQKLTGTLIPEAETICLALSPVSNSHDKSQPNGDMPDGVGSSAQSLAAVNKEGSIELFPSPFDFTRASKAKDSESVKARRKGMTRKATASIKITRPDKSSTLVPILNLSFDGDEIVVAWTEGGVNVLFDRLRWREENTGRMVLQGVHELVKAKAGAGIGGAFMNGVKDMGKSYVDDSHTVIGNGGDALLGMDPSSAIDISSAEEESEYSEEEDEDQEDHVRSDPSSQTSSQNKEDPQPEPMSQRHSPEDKDVDMEDADKQDAFAGQEEDEAKTGDVEPSFGEMIRANAQGPIDVQATFPLQGPQAITTSGERSLPLPSGMSLGTVLTQSLRTNDNNLLETCFHVRDLRTVRATIERIDSPLATILLQRLTERLHSRPGRAGSLMVWIQWTLVAHGGYLASQPDVMKKLNSLHRVVAERANSLQSLLSLKGKLDMLEAQMNLRKSMQSRSRAANAPDEDDEEGIIYVEGQEESDDSDTDDEPDDAMQTDQIAGNDTEGHAEVASADEASDEEGVDDGEDDGMPSTMNGFVADSEDEGSESDDEALIDDEAVSTDADSDDDDSADGVDHDDVSSIDSEASSEPEDIPPAKRLAKTKLTNGISKKSR